ncbi:hypothetical protein B0T22DRAFT_469166 [Podospora appendiculata]|uniref:Uncharacterized protein n=1 Tax=Podospora appendiculata TaxID=314037 RepID=A0AAE0X334_9PEZI|nr:hypothetical protein B0T22DRAFT_469166 [Podospora appendiculata]
MTSHMCKHAAGGILFIASQMITKILAVEGVKSIYPAPLPPQERRTRSKLTRRIDAYECLEMQAPSIVGPEDVWVCVSLPQASVRSEMTCSEKPQRPQTNTPVIAACHSSILAWLFP